MPQFSQRSLDRISTTHPDLQKVLKEAIINGPDFTIIFGHRGEEDQEKAFREGKSRLRWPQSKHNQLPSTAVDIAPWTGGIDWQNINAFRRLASYIMGIADANGVRMRWGGDWDRDWSEEDERSLRDFCHLELLNDD